jgi:RNA polymerase sigma-70 factor (ECF subfamily)
MSEPSDLDLLTAWRAGDASAGNTLLVRLFPMVYRFFASKLDRGIDDLAQRTFETCVASRERIPAHAGLRAWVLGVARNHLLHELRSRMRHDDRLQPLEVTVEGIVGSPSALVAERDEQRILVHALRRIPIDFQITLELFYWEDMSVAEAAFVLGVEEGTVRSRLTRARKLLEQRIEQAASRPELGESTIRSLDTWARSLREILGPRDPVAEPD